MDCVRAMRCYKRSSDELLRSSLRAIHHNHAKKTTVANTASVQTAAVSCHVQFTQPYIQLQVISTVRQSNHQQNEFP